MSTSQKTIFITGSSSGLGRAAAKLFASKGWKVIATMRTPEKETELASIPGVKLMALDTTDADQIQSVAQDVIAHGGVDVGSTMRAMVWRVPSKASRTTRSSA